MGWNYGTRNQGFASVLQVVLDTPMTAIGVELSEILGTGLAFKNEGHEMRWWTLHSKEKCNSIDVVFWMKIDNLGGSFLISLDCGRCPEELNQEEGKHSKTGSRPFGEGWSSKASAVAGTLGLWMNTCCIPDWNTQNPLKKHLNNPLTTMKQDELFLTRFFFGSKKNWSLRPLIWGLPLTWRRLPRAW